MPHERVHLVGLGNLNLALFEKGRGVAKVASRRAAERRQHRVADHRLCRRPEGRQVCAELRQGELRHRSMQGMVAQQAAHEVNAFLAAEIVRAGADRIRNGLVRRQRVEHLRHPVSADHDSHVRGQPPRPLDHLGRLAQRVPVHLQREDVVPEAHLALEFLHRRMLEDAALDVEVLRHEVEGEVVAVQRQRERAFGGRKLARERVERIDPAGDRKRPVGASEQHAHGRFLRCERRRS